MWGRGGIVDWIFVVAGPAKDQLTCTCLKLVCDVHNEGVIRRRIEQGIVIDTVLKDM